MWPVTAALSITTNCSAGASVCWLAMLADSLLCVRFFWQEKKINTDRNQYAYFVMITEACKMRVTMVALLFFIRWLTLAGVCAVVFMFPGFGLLR